MAKRFVSIGECMVEMSGGEDRTYRLGYAGDTLNTIWYARALLPADWTTDYVTALGDDLYSREMRTFLGTAGIGTGHIQEIPVNGRVSTSFTSMPGIGTSLIGGTTRRQNFWRTTSGAGAALRGARIASVIPENKSGRRHAARPPAPPRRPPEVLPPSCPANK